MSYTYSESKTDLVINKLSRSIYKQLRDAGNLNENEIYSITDPILDESNSVKVYKDGEEFADKLSVINLSRSDYYGLLTNDQLSPSALYVVNEIGVDAFDTIVSGVADPVISSDAANKHYVDSEIAKIDASNQLTSYYTKSQVNALSTTFRSGLATTNSLTAYQPKGNYLTAHQSLDNYYTKSQVNDISSYLNDRIGSSGSTDGNSTPLVGKTYDLSQNGMFTKLVVDIGRALGATITNSPVDGLLAASIVDGDEMRFGN